MTQMSWDNHFKGRNTLVQMKWDKHFEGQKYIGTNEMG